jgi:hypothetical protein
MRTATTIMVAMALCCIYTGCMGRIFSEGMGAATGASGRVVENSSTPDLTKYKSLHVEPITIAAGSQASADMPDMAQADFEAAARFRGLTPDGKPGLKFVGEIIHYESSSTVDTAIGPLAEVIVRAKLIDADSGKVLAEANLVGRSKASSSSGAKHLSRGLGKALGKWLDSGGLKKEKGGDKEED